MKLMISKGADNLNWRLFNAYIEKQADVSRVLIAHGATDWPNGYYSELPRENFDILLLTIQKGASINGYEPDLTTDHLLYLYHNGITEFGKYRLIIDNYRHWRQTIYNNLSAILNNDLCNIAYYYI